MPITKFIVGGFRSLRDIVEVPLAPVTLMFGPNSSGKTSVKEAWVELRRLFDEGNTFNPEAWQLYMHTLAMDRVDRNAYRVSGEPFDADDPDAVKYRVVLGCEIEAFDTETATDSGLNDEWAGIGLELYKGLAEHTIRYLMANDADDHCAQLILNVDGQDVLAFYSYATALQAGFVDATRIPGSKPDSASFSKHMGLLQVNLSSPVFDMPQVRQLLASLCALAVSSEDKRAHRALQVKENFLIMRMHGIKRRLLPWRASFVDVTSERLSSEHYLTDHFEVTDKLTSLLNQLLRQIEWAIHAQMDWSLVSGDRQRLSSEQLQFTTSDHILPFTDPRPTSLFKYAMFLGTRQADFKDEQIVWLNEHFTPQDDFINDVFSTELFSPRKYKVRADFSVMRETILTSRNPEQVGGENVFYKSALYLVDEQQRPLDFDQVGSGVSYTLPILAALWDQHRAWIEQPELHLHPAAQCEIGDAIVRAFNRGRFAVIESHSEHILLRILRRIRQTSAGKIDDKELACQPEAVVVLYFAPQVDGSTQIHRLRVTRGGDFMDQWPNGFFEERSRELFDE